VSVPAAETAETQQPVQQQPELQHPVLDALIAGYLLTHPPLAQFMQRRRSYVAGMSGTRLAQLAQVLHQVQQQALADGQVPEPEEVKQQLDAVLASPAVGGAPDGPAASSAANVGQTEVSAAVAEAAHDTYRNAGVAATEWLTAEDEKVCPICAANEAAGAVPMGMPFPSGDLMPPAHPRCLPGNTLVTASSRITGATSRVYNGDLVSIRTLTGKLLTATPNHPVLTNQGWVPAGVVQVGEQVVTSSWSQRVRGVDNNHQHMPATVKQVAEAFLRSGQVLSAEVPVAAEDFHGDGAGSEICIVGAYRRLPTPYNATVVHKCGHQVFQRRDVTRLGFAPLGRRNALFVGKRHSAHRRMRSANQPLALLGAGPGHTQVHAGASAPWLNAVLHEPKPYHWSADAEGFAQRLLTLSSDIALDEVVHVEVATANTHVYNLETESGWYIANGIVTHNCRCTHTPTDYYSVPPYVQQREGEPLRWFGWPDTSLTEEQRLQNKGWHDAWMHEARGFHGEWAGIDTFIPGMKPAQGVKDLQTVVKNISGAGDHEVTYGRMPTLCPACNGIGGTCEQCGGTGKQPTGKCLSCGCGLPHDDHGDPRNITQDDVQAAAAAAELPGGQAASNIADWYRSQPDADDAPTAKVLTADEIARIDDALMHAYKKKSPRGNAQTLRDYWSGHGHAGPSHGAERDAIAWGTPGDFDRCVAMVTTHAKMSPEQAKGYCAERHHDALGIWPATHAKDIREASGGSKKHVSIADLVKAGPEGYIHGWICVRPPCGEKDSLHLEENEQATFSIPGHGMMASYRIVHGGTGQQLGTVRPTGDREHGVQFAAYNNTNVHTPSAVGDDPASGLRQVAREHDLRLLRDKASAAGFTEPRRQLDNARNQLMGGREDAAAESLRSAQQTLDAIPPVTDPRGFSNAKDVAQLRNGVVDLYHDLTGDELPERKLEVPDEPWAKTGKIRRSQLEVHWGDGSHAEVIHKPTGIQVGTIDQEWLSKRQPHLAKGTIASDSKAYYTGRHADGSVVSFAASDAKQPGADKALTRLIDAHNKRLEPAPPREPEPPVPALPDKPPDWFLADHSINSDSLDSLSGTYTQEQLARAHQQIRDQLNHQARYVPNVVARAKVNVTKPTGGGVRSNWLGEHYGTNGTINIKPEILDSLGDPVKNDRTLVSGQGTWWPPADDKWSLADTVLAHEIGHGVADRGLSARYAGPDLWKKIADGIGVMPPMDLEKKSKFDYEQAVNRWIGSNKAKIAREVSDYGSANMNEMLAELWQEYTQSSNPRAAAKAYGEYVMRYLKDREKQP